MKTLRQACRLLLRFRQLDMRRRAMVAEAIACLAIARLALIAVPFPRIARRLGDFVPPEDPRAARATIHAIADAAIACDIGWAVTRAARYMPFDAVCLPQAMAARLMLERRGVFSVMHLGACAPSDTVHETHAWLNAAGVEVTGYPVAARFTEIACFL
jgi:hypothetical protein